MLVEAAWCYRHHAREERRFQERVAGLPEEIRAIGWAAQVRLCRRFRHLIPFSGELFTSVALMPEGGIGGGGVMWTRFAVADHLDSEELAARYRQTRDPIERGRWQMIWLLVVGRSLQEVAGVTGYSTRWVRELVRRYNARGPEGLADGRHANPGAAPLLDAAGRQALDAALAKPPPEGGQWTCAKVAAWIARRTGRAKVPVQRGWVYLQRTGHSRQVPRPRHVRAADAAAQAAFKKD